MTIYFKHPYKTDIHSEYVQEESYLSGVNIKRVYQPFYGNSFELSGYDLYNNQVDKFLFGLKDEGVIDDDLPVSAHLVTAQIQ